MADEKVQESVELPEPVRLAGETKQEVLLVTRLTTLAKPFRADTVTVEVLGEPVLTVRLVGLAEREKSGPLTALS